MDGLIRGVEEAEYRAHPAVSNSDLKNLRRSPAYAQWQRTHPSEQSKTMAFGTAVHAAVLEPDKFRATYVVDLEAPETGGYPPGWRNTKAYKGWKAEQAAAGRLAIPVEMMDACMTVVSNLHEHPIGKMIFEVQDGTEFSVFAQDDRFEHVTRKCRPDLLAPAAKTCVDLKTAAEIEAWTFARNCANYGYHRGAAYYMDTLDLIGESYDHYVLLVVANTAPFEVRAYTLDDDSISQGRYEYRKLLAQWAACEASGEWVRGPEKIEELRLPQYAIDYMYDEGEDDG